MKLSNWYIIKWDNFFLHTNPNKWLITHQFDCYCWCKVLQSTLVDLKVAWYITLWRTRNHSNFTKACISIFFFSGCMMTTIKYCFYIVWKPRSRNPRKALSSWAKNKFEKSKYAYLDSLRVIEVGIMIH